MESANQTIRNLLLKLIIVIAKDCEGLIEQSTIINQTTGYEKKYYTVLKIDRRIDESSNQKTFLDKD